MNYASNTLKKVIQRKLFALNLKNILNQGLPKKSSRTEDRPGRISGAVKLKNPPIILVVSNCAFKPR